MATRVNIGSAITYTSVDLSSMWFCGINLRSVLREVFMISSHQMLFKNTPVNLFSHLLAVTISSKMSQARAQSVWETKR